MNEQENFGATRCSECNLYGCPWQHPEQVALCAACSLCPDHCACNDEYVVAFIFAYLDEMNKGHRPRHRRDRKGCPRVAR